MQSILPNTKIVYVEDAGLWFLYLLTSGEIRWATIASRPNINDIVAVQQSFIKSHLLNWKNEFTDERLTALVDNIASASGWGGLDSSTMYGEFALDVAKAMREQFAKMVEDFTVII